MKALASISCLVLMLWTVPSAMAQFMPITAKSRTVHYKTQSDGTEREMSRREGKYYRASNGSWATLGIYKGAFASRAMLDASTGKLYQFSPVEKVATVKSQKSLPLSPNTSAFDSTLVDETETVNGISCTKVRMVGPAGDTSRATAWVSTELDLEVKTEFVIPGTSRTVREIYDIQFTEPSSSAFRVPSGYSVDESSCRGCN